MKAGDTHRRDVIRLLRSAMKYQEIEVRRPLEDADSIEVIQAQIKQRRDSIDAFEQGGRTDLADKEKAELTVLEEYLPAELRPMDADVLQSIVEETIRELGLSSPADMRVLMPALIQKTAGRADNRLLSKMATAKLQEGAIQH
jgi:uncharacterized protein YqeY